MVELIIHAKCGALTKANKVIDMYKRKDAFWTVLIIDYAYQELGLDALKYFQHMQHGGMHLQKCNGCLGRCLLGWSGCLELF